MLQKPEISAGLMGHLARMQTLPTYVPPDRQPLLINIKGSLGSHIPLVLFPLFPLIRWTPLEEYRNSKWEVNMLTEICQNYVTDITVKCQQPVQTLMSATKRMYPWGPDHTINKCVFKSLRFHLGKKRSKIFSPTLAFSFCFHLSTLMRFHSKTHTFWCVFAYRPH